MKQLLLLPFLCLMPAAQAMDPAPNAVAPGPNNAEDYDRCEYNKKTISEAQARLEKLMSSPQLQAEKGALKRTRRLIADAQAQYDAAGCAAAKKPGPNAIDPTANPTANPVMDDPTNNAIDPANNAVDVDQRR